MTFHIGYKKVDLSPQQYAVLDSLIKPKIDKIVGIKINAHTDNIGSVKYNMILSQDRAMNMANYFKKIGVPSKKLVACFYGKSKPIAPNQNEDGSDNPEGRYLNRRIEIEFFMKE
jgi:outer membrane protein OmpA-like peptidoglycan-associated protein